MFCHKCGNQLPENARFCQKCGAKVLFEDVIQKSSPDINTSENKGMKQMSSQTAIGSNQVSAAKRDSFNDQKHFEEFVGNHVRKTTQFQSAEELLNSHVPLGFVKKPLAISFILGILLCVFGYAKGNLKLTDAQDFIGGLVIVLFFLLIGWAVAICKGVMMAAKYPSKYDGKFEENVDTEDLMQFLNKYLTYLSPYFHQWGYLKRSAFGMRGLVSTTIEESMQKAMKETRICTGFGKKQRQLSVIVLRPDPLNTESGKMEYFASAENRFEGGIFSLFALFFHDYGFEKYKCVVRTAPILQAAMEYYLKEYRTMEKDLSSISQNLTKEETDNKICKTSGKFPAEKSYGNNIKSYYCEQFDRIAGGEKTKFNWAALLFGGCNQLYNGCTKVFCRTYLPLLAVGIVINLITILATVRLNFTLMFIMPSLGGIWGLCYLGLSFLNGFKFNTWFYHDFISDPDKKRSRKGLGVFIVSAIVVCAVMCTLPFILKSSSDDLESLDLIGEKNEGVDLSEIYTNKEDIMVSSDESDQKMNSLNTEYSEETLDDIPFGYEGDETDYREAYSSKVLELSEEDNSLQFALIDLVDNGVPELVADNPGYYVSIFTWADGEVVTLMDQWGYGIGGNNGYEYLPSQNVIRSYDMESAGAVIYESYLEVNNDYEIVSIFDEELSIRMLKDTNNNGMIDEEDEYTGEPAYYCDGIEVSEEEYVSYQINGDYKLIEGNMSVDIMLDFIWAEEYEEEVTLSDFSNDSLYLYGGSYEGSEDTSMYVSVYSSFDEGNILGSVTIYDALGNENYAKIRDDMEGDGIYTLCCDDFVAMVRFYQDYDGRYCADIQGLDEIYSNGNQIETYIMTEQYIP